MSAQYKFSHTWFVFVWENVSDSPSWRLMSYSLLFPSGFQTIFWNFSYKKKKKKIPSDYNSFFEIGSFCLSMPWDNQLKRVKLRNQKKSPKLWDHQPVICLQQHQFSFSWWKLSILGHFIIDLTQFFKSTALSAHCVFINVVIVTRRP